MLKKIIITCNGVLFLLVLFFTLNFWLDSQVEDLLYQEVQQVQIEFNDQYTKNEFVTFIKNYATDNQINISQYSFPAKNKMVIYSANPSGQVNWKDQLKGNGQRKYFENSKQTKHSYLAVPNNHFQIQIEPFETIFNTGLGNHFYFSELKGDTLKKLETFGKVEYLPQVVKASIYQVDSYLVIMIIYLLVFLLILFLIHFFTSINLIAVKQSLGYRRREIILQQIAPFLKPILLSNSVISLFFLIYFLGEFPSLLAQLAVTLAIACVFTLLVLLICGIVNLLSLLIHFKVEYVNGKKPAKYLIPLLSIFTLVSCLSFFYCYQKVEVQYQTYTDEAVALQEFGKYPDVYGTNITNQLNRADPAIEGAYQVKAKKYFRSVKKDLDYFIISAHNFSNVNQDPENPLFLYQLNSDNEHDSIVSPYGQSIVVDANYVIKQNIQLTDSGNIRQLLHTPKNTLTVLVPEKYRPYEAEIKEKYLEDYQFRMVEINNMYLADDQKQVVATDLNLAIKVVYAKNNQQYFTFNNLEGDAKSGYLIHDPIAIIFEDNLENLFYGNLFASGGGLHFSTNQAKPYELLAKKLKEYDLGAVINQTESLYSKNGLQLNNLRVALITSITNAVIFSALSIFLFLVLFNILYHFYGKIHFLKTALGYNFVARNYFAVMLIGLIDLILVVFSRLRQFSMLLNFLLLFLITFNLLAMIICDRIYGKKYFEVTARGGEK